jgi:hypothetical protein
LTKRAVLVSYRTAAADRDERFSGTVGHGIVQAEQAAHRGSRTGLRRSSGDLHTGEPARLRRRGRAGLQGTPQAGWTLVADGYRPWAAITRGAIRVPPAVFR